MGYWELSVNELFHSHLQIRTQWWRGVLNVKIQQTGEKKIKWILPSKDWCSPLFEFVVCLLSISSLQWVKLNPQNTPTHTLASTQLPDSGWSWGLIDQVCHLSELSHQLHQKTQQNNEAVCKKCMLFDSFVTFKRLPCWAIFPCQNVKTS